MSDLSLVETDELVAELFKRHDAVLVVRTRNKTEDDERISVHSHGPVSHCLGLAQIAIDELMNEFREMDDDE